VTEKSWLPAIPFQTLPVIAFQLNRWRVLLACVFLAVATLVVYWPARHYKFVAYDDNDYVYENQIVRAGLTWHGIEWAFVDRQANNWHPLTWLSHMTDCQLFGLNAGGPHMVNVAVHCANTILLFLLLQALMRNGPEPSPRQTNVFWRNVFVAGLFALHPLRVESVAWISERKDVLSAFFGLLSLLCYVRYARGSGNPRLSLSYRGAVIFFACSLLSKPMLVTLPLLMLLLDYWPLERFNTSALLPRQNSAMAGAEPFQRFNVSTFQRLLREKWLFFFFAAVFCGITLVAQQPGLPGQNAGLATRLEGISANYAGYIKKLLWPQHLSFLYLRPDVIPAAQWVPALFALLLISAVVYCVRLQHPALLAGWLWFLFVLLPVCGVVSLGRLSIADRYTYLPSIGFYLMITWGVADLAGKFVPATARHLILLTGGATILALCALLSRWQLSYWEDTKALYEHALQVDPNNSVAKQNLHIYLFEKANPKVRNPPPE
jgi:protein O-mannosyl-transferase